MTKKPASIDGFVSRSSSRPLGDIHRSSLGRFDSKTTIEHGEGTKRPITTADLTPPRKSVSRSEIDESLKDIEDEDTVKPRRGLFRRKPKQPKSRRRKIIGWIVKLLLIIAILVGAYVGIKAIMASTAVFKGNFFGIFQSKPLEMDENGRTNVLVFGTSGSVEDNRHKGADLTDTLMVLSIDQNKKNAYMVSLPRDLYVQYDGRACPEGYQGKINSMYDCYSEQGKNDEAGAKALQKKVKQVTGLTLQYYAHVNWAVVTSAIKAVGGVDVEVKGNGPCSPYGYPDGSVVDYNMKINFKPGVHHMNADEALRFSRARSANPNGVNCGLARGDFDRQINQQKVLVALRKKAASGETLTNLGKVTGLIDALGQNLRTNFDTSEIQTLMRLAKDIPTEKIVSIDLVDKENAVIASSNIVGSTQSPVAGMYEYSGIKAYIKKKINSNDITREGANVALFNGSGAEGYAKKRQTALEKQGFTVTTVDNAPAGKYSSVQLYDLSDGDKPKTKAKLEGFYSVKAKKTSPPVIVPLDTDFVVIYGKAVAY
ncbi:MAG TPA: LCP family protein [Candidatus Saccharimonadales bacterium]